ncbi:unnamed protein product [Chrysoparadoxa australica]
MSQDVQIKPKKRLKGEEREGSTPAPAVIGAGPKRPRDATVEAKEVPKRPQLQIKKRPLLQSPVPYQKGRPGCTQPGPVLFLRVSNIVHDVTVMAVHEICQRYGKVLRIVLFDCESGGPAAMQALVEYEDAASSVAAHNDLDSEEMYAGCNLVRTGFSNLRTITVQANTARSWEFCSPKQAAPPPAYHSSAPPGHQPQCIPPMGYIPAASGPVAPVWGAPYPPTAAGPGCQHPQGFWIHSSALGQGAPPYPYPPQGQCQPWNYPPPALPPHSHPSHMPQQLHQNPYPHVPQNPNPNANAYPHASTPRHLVQTYPHAKSPSLPQGHAYLQHQHPQHQVRQGVHTLKKPGSTSPYAGGSMAGGSGPAPATMASVLGTAGGSTMAVPPPPPPPPRLDQLQLGRHPSSNSDSDELPMAHERLMPRQVQLLTRAAQDGQRAAQGTAEQDKSADNTPVHGMAHLAAATAKVSMSDSSDAEGAKPSLLEDEISESADAGAGDAGDAGDAGGAGGASDAWLKVCPPEANSNVVLVQQINTSLVSDEALFQLFGVYGDVLKVKSKHSKNKLEPGLGLCFVEYRYPLEASNGCQFLHDTELCGTCWKLQLSNQETIRDPAAADFTPCIGTVFHRYTELPDPSHEVYQQALVPPSTSLVVEGPGTSVDEVRALLLEKGVDACLQSVERSNDESGEKMTKLLVRMETVEAAIRALIMLHGVRLVQTGAGDGGGEENEEERKQGGQEGGGERRLVVRFAAN